MFSLKTHGEVSLKNRTELQHLLAIRIRKLGYQGLKLIATLTFTYDSEDILLWNSYYQAKSVLRFRASRFVF